tara:strand:+ start:342 stop:1148 length:807 start_codon:yes stop_codon:yes gene_type:complete
MSKQFNYFLCVTFFSFFLVSCNEYQKILNSEDNNLKYKTAEEYYNNGEYRRANRLLEQLVPIYRGKPQAERLVYFFADSYFQTKNYYLASYQFESFIKSFPKSQKLEEASFFAAKSHYMMSPTFSLDQEETNTAIEKLQIFMNNYPKSKFTDECNQLISELQNKIEKKEFEVAKQYFTIYDFRAAIKALDNFVADFVGSKFREEALYYKFLASYEIAINSIQSKKYERLLELKQIHNSIVRYYPETLFEEDLTKKMNSVDKEINNFTN